MFTPMSQSIEYITGRQVARACGDSGDALGQCCRTSRPWRIRAGLRGERLVRHRRAQKHAGRDRRQAQQGDQAGLADPKIKARLADLGGMCRLPRSPAEFGKLIADETEKWGKVIRAANIKPE